MKRNILVVDDDFDTRHILNRILTSEGFLAYSSTNEEETLNLLIKKPIDLILLDLRLKSESGFDLCRRLKAHKSFSKIPVIVISVSHLTEDIVKAIELGAADFVSKPFDQGVLVAKIRSILRLKDEEERLRKGQKELIGLIQDTSKQKDLLSREAEFSRDLNQFLDEESKKIFIRKSFSDFLGAKLFSIFIYDEDEDIYKLFVSNHSEIPQELSVKLEESSIMYDAVSKKQPIFIQSFSKSEYKKSGREKYETDTVCVVPLISGDRVIGILTVNDPTFSFYDPADFEGRITRISRHLGVSIHNTILYEKVKDLSMRDSMTGLYNFRHFLETLRLEVERARRYNEHLSCIMVDIDNFKTVNDTYGHQIGDEVLKELARSISYSVRASDIPARYGGDEFIIILPRTDKDLTTRLASRLMNLFSGKPIRIPHDEKGIKVTLSMGIAAFPEDTANMDELMKMADEALYQAKNQGKNRIVSYSH